VDMNKCKHEEKLQDYQVDLSQLSQRMGMFLLLEVLLLLLFEILMGRGIES
jgi:hypothetical protein